MKGVSRYKFLKSKNMKPQCFPVKRGGLLDELSPFLNMSRKMKVLFAVNLVQAFIPESSHFLMVISSEQGSGKSTLTRLIRNIIDPALSVITTMPENADALKNHLANNLVVCFDNTQPLSDTFSDILCGAVTGTTYAKRRLYSDSDEIILRMHNLVILNGIDAIPKKSDLLERSMLFKLEKISTEGRLTDSQIKSKMEECTPCILNAIFETLVSYFKIRDDVKVNGSHRMADAYRECCIISRVLGVEDEFLSAFDENQRLLQDDYSTTSPLISAINSYFEAKSKTSLSNSVSNVYNTLLEYADKHTFPKSPSAFSRAIKNEEGNLSKSGIRLSIMKQRNCTKIVIKKN